MDILNKERDLLVDELKGIGAEVQIDERRKRLIVNNEYEISYTNFYYFEKGSNKSISRGRRDFVEYVKDKSSNA